MRYFVHKVVEFRIPDLQFLLDLLLFRDVDIPHKVPMSYLPCAPALHIRSAKASPHLCGDEQFRSLYFITGDKTIEIIPLRFHSSGTMKAFKTMTFQFIYAVTEHLMESLLICTTLPLSSRITIAIGEFWNNCENNVRFYASIPTPLSYR